MPDHVPFLPSRCGFAYTNCWPPQPAVTLHTPFGDIDVGDASGGLCGGMVFAALDFWHAGVLPPVEQPAHDQPIYRYIIRRLIDSWNLPAGVTQYYQWMNLPDGDRGFTALGQHIVVERGLAWRTLRVQWPQIAADLDRGLPVPLAIVTVASANPADLSHNHQVLCYGFTRTGTHLTVRVYDPNQGQRDDIAIEVDTADPTRPTTFRHNLALDRPVRGFFRTAYAPVTPPD